MPAKEKTLKEASVTDLKRALAQYGPFMNPKRMLKAINAACEVGRYFLGLQAEVKALQRENAELKGKLNLEDRGEQSLQ